MALELDALEEQQPAVLDEQHLVADVAVERGAQLAPACMASANWSTRKSSVMSMKRLVVFAFDVERCRRQALANSSAWASSAAWPCNARTNVEPPCPSLRASAMDLPSNMTVAVEAQRFLAREIRDLEVLEGDAVLSGDGVRGKS